MNDRPKTSEGPVPESGQAEECVVEIDKALSNVNEEAVAPSKLCCLALRQEVLVDLGIASHPTQRRVSKPVLENFVILGGIPLHGQFVRGGRIQFRDVLPQDPLLEPLF